MKQLLRLQLIICLLLLNKSAFSQQIIWEKGFEHSPGADVFLPLTKINDTTVIAGGSTSRYRSFYVKYHINGQEVWNRTGRQFITGEQDICPFTNGYFYTGAVPNRAVNQGSSVMLQRLNMQGDTIWTKVYAGFLNDEAYRMQVAGDNIYITGVGINRNRISYTLHKTDTLGVLIWRKFYYPITWFGSSYPCDLLVRPSGNLIISGISQAANQYFRLHLLEVNTNGDSLRSATISLRNVAANEMHYRAYNNFSLTSDGKYIASGTIDSAGHQLGYVVKIDTSLSLIWSTIIRPTAPQKRMQTSKVKELPNGNFALLATDNSQLTNNIHVYTISPAGKLQNRTSFSSTYCSNLRILDWVLLNDGGSIVSGRCFSRDETYIARIRVLPTGIAESVSINDLNLGDAYPNPTQDEITIPYSLPRKFRTATLLINEVVTGHQIKTYDLKSNKFQERINISLNDFSVVV